MGSQNNHIFAIDISSSNVKVGLISDKLELISAVSRPYSLINEDIDGFARRFDMDVMWDNIISGVNEILEKHKPGTLNVVGISSCAQRGSRNDRGIRSCC